MFIVGGEELGIFSGFLWIVVLQRLHGSFWFV